MEEREKEIDLMDLCFKILKKWKWMLFYGVLIALLCVGLRYRKDKIQALELDKTEKKNVDTEDKEDVLKAMQEKLTADQYSNVSTYISLYESLSVRRQARDTSIRYQIDPYHEKVLCLTYAVRLPDIDDSDSDDSTETMGEYLIAEHLSDDTKLTQLATIYHSHILGTEIINLISDVTMDISENDLRSLITSTVSNKLVYVNVKYTDDMDIQTISGLIKNDLEQYSAELQGMEEHEFILVDESYVEVIDDDLIKVQYDELYSEYSLQSQMNLIENNFDDVEKEYIQTYLGNQNVGDVVEKNPVRLSKKMLIIGFAIGVFIVCLWEIMRYTLSGRLHTAEGLSEYYGLRLFGIQLNTDAGVSKRGIDKWIYRLENRNQKYLTPDVRKEIILSSIMIYCKQNSIDRVVLTGTDIEDINEEYISQLQADMKEANIIATVEKDINYYPEALQRAAEVGNIILFETIEKSIESEIENILIKAREYNINVLGTVVFSDV